VSDDTDPDDDHADTDPLAWETTASETDYTCPGFDVRRDEVRLPGGSEGEFHSVTDDPSVVILPFNEGGDVVVIEEWRQAVRRVNLGLPAGGLEGDEEPREAVNRELAEETGYEAGGVEELATYEPANGLFDSAFHYFVAHGCTPTAEQDLDHNESIRVDTRTFTELEERALAGDLRDGRSALAVLQYALRSRTA
jgi:ADP-ribose pyrophosphatase